MSDAPSSSVEFRREGGSTNDPPGGCRSRSGSSSSSGSLVGEAEEDYCENSPWVFIPEPMFTKIFLYLEPRDMLNAGQTCKRWNKLSRDDYIWRKYFQREFNVDTNIGLKPGKSRPIFGIIVCLNRAAGQQCDDGDIIASCLPFMCEKLNSLSVSCLLRMGRGLRIIIDGAREYLLFIFIFFIYFLQLEL